MAAPLKSLSHRSMRFILLIICAFYCYISAPSYSFGRLDQPITTTEAFQFHTNYPQTYLPRYSRNITVVAPEYFDRQRFHNRQANLNYQQQQAQNLYDDRESQYQYQQQQQQHQHPSYLTNRAESSNRPSLSSIGPESHNDQSQQAASLYGQNNRDSGNSDECPSECRCNKVAQIADCSNRSLIIVPTGFPKDVKRINLAGNNIRSLGPNAFQGLKRLQRIDLSNNNLQKIDPLAFSGGLQSLNSLLLYSNKLKYLPATLFRELNQLQLLLLNDNSLRCIDKDLLSSLSNLNLLSLHDNNIETLANGTFDGLKNIRTIHLGKNPLICDCNLRWLADYLELNPIETSQALCDGPTPRNAGKRLSQLSKQRFRCEGNEQAKTDHIINQCAAAASVDQCPPGCLCNGSLIDCSESNLHSESRAGGSALPALQQQQQQPQTTGAGASGNGLSLVNGGGDNTAGAIYELPDVPDDVPVYVARVPLNDQRIKRIRQTGLFRKLANTQKLDLGNSKIIDIEDNVINSVGTGTKPERIVFVLLENQSCEPTTISPRLPEDQQQQQQRPQQFEQRHQAYTTPQTPAAAMTTAASMITHQSTQSFIQPQLLLEDVCSLAPKVSGDSPCFNGGLCKTSDLSASNFTCLCAPGFTGPLCETNIDDCVDHQCQNGAICVDGVQSYKCICRDPTTSGEFCEQLNSYTTSSANSIAPMALPIIASSAPQQQTITTTSYGGELTPQVQSAPKQQMIRTNINNINSNIQNAIGSQQQQILTRSADFAPSAKSSATVSAIAVADPDASCKRITRRTYFDDGNGCQSARMLKMSECSGYCTGNSNGSDSGEGCCIATKVKRRRIRMQCNDGASYVKTIDLVKKCSCSNDCSNIELTQPPFLNQPPQQRQQQHGSPSPFPNYYNASQDDQLLQITRLDAVD